MPTLTSSLKKRPTNHPQTRTQVRRHPPCFVTGLGSLVYVFCAGFQASR